MELKVIINPIDGAGPAKRLLSNLFYGGGYNFYRGESELRADDLVIRGKLCQLLRECRLHLSALEEAFRRQHRAPDRDYAFLNPVAVSLEQALLRAQREIHAMEMAIRTAALPETDYVQPRHRKEGCTLEKLVMLDGEALLALVTLRDAVAKLTDGAAAATRMEALLKASDFSALWSRREALLAGISG